MKLALNYLKNYTRVSDFCYESLEKLAQATEKSAKEHTSTFDIMITDVIKKPEHDEVFDTLYEEFNNCWTPDYTHNLIEALTCMRNRIEDHYKCGIIRFSIPTRVR